MWATISIYLSPTNCQASCEALYMCSLMCAYRMGGIIQPISQMYTKVK